MQQLKNLRLAGAITRYHTARTIRTQSVGEHSWGVAQLMVYLSPNVSAQALIGALHHDLSELATGDIPAPVKWENAELKDLLKAVEHKFDNMHGLAQDLTRQEYHLLKWCDMMELVLWCMEEMELGNRTIGTIIERGLDYLINLGHPNEKAQELYDVITSQYESQ